MREGAAQQKKLEEELETSRKELSASLQTNQGLFDEHQALQLAYNSHEVKLKDVEVENDRLVGGGQSEPESVQSASPQRKQLMSYKAKDADRLNDQNEKFRSDRERQLKEEIEQATREPSAPSPSKLAEKKGRKASSSVSEGAGAPSICPSTILESMVTALLKLCLCPQLFFCRRCMTMR